MTFLWSIAALACVLAGTALMKAWLTAKRFERLAQSYWELRYEHGQLASRLTRLEASGTPESPDPQQQPAGQPSGTTFVPLSSLKR